jgi:20S proteasome alpha/beta subunit
MALTWKLHKKIPALECPNFLTPTNQRRSRTSRASFIKLRNQVFLKLATMSDPFSINGGSIVALVGKECVGIACDLRLGQQAMTVSTDFPKIFPMGEKVFLGLSGLATDVQTL